MKQLCFLIVGLLVSACSGTSTGKGGSAASGSEKACGDAADAVANAAARCGQDYQKNYDAFVATGAGGSCANVTSIRDEPALRTVCIPSMATVSCPDLIAGRLDGSCKGQLVRPASWTPATTLAPASDYASFGVDE